MGSSCSSLSRSSPRRKRGTWRCLPCSKEMVCCHLRCGTSRNLGYMVSSCKTLSRSSPACKTRTGIVCRAANWCLLNAQGLSLRRQDNHAEEEPHEEVLFGFPIGGCFHPSAGVTDWSGRFLVGYFLCL